MTTPRTPLTSGEASECRQFINDLLDGDEAARVSGRRRLWTYVWTLIQRQLTLPIGPLNDDIDEKSNIALEVMKKLEEHDYKRLRGWRDDYRASFGRFVQVVATRAAIDYARSYARQVAPRGQPFVWITEESHDPWVLAETVQRQLDFLGGAGVPQLTEHLERFAAASAAVPEPETHDRPRAGPPRRNARGTVSKHVLRRK